LKHRRQLEALDHGVQAGAPHGAAQSTQVGDELEEPERGHFPVRRRALGQVPDAGLGADRVGLDIVAVDRGTTRRRSDESGQHPHCGRLAGPVRAEEAEHFPGPHFEAQVVDGRQRAVAFGQVFGLDHGRQIRISRAQR